jgi:acetyltransferase-like isoleucine patch superfamily enzyme
MSAESFVHPSAEVDEPGAIGPATRVWQLVRVMRGAVVGAECSLGRGVFLGEGTVVGDRVKIGNGANIYGATIESEAFIGPMALLMEDARPRATNPDGSRKGPADWTATPVHVGRGATICGGALILPGVTVGAWAMVSAGAVVHRDVPPHAIVAGNPAREVGLACRCGDRLVDARCPSCGTAYAVDDDPVHPIAPMGPDGEIGAPG